jgi:hypothetical protein
MTTDLDAAKKIDPGTPSLGFSFRTACGGVVVGEGDGAQIQLFCQPHNIGWREGSIGRGGMAVKIN